MASGHVWLFMIIIIAIAHHAQGQQENKTVEKSTFGSAYDLTRCTTLCVGACSLGDFKCLEKCKDNCKKGIWPNGATVLKISGLTLALYSIISLFSKYFIN